MLQVSQGSAATLLAEVGKIRIVTCDGSFINATVKTALKFIDFYRVTLWYCGICYGPVSVCLCLCLSVTSPCSTKTAKWTELIFGMEDSFDLSCTVL